jgi:putative glutamine amidotransferase
VSAQPSSTLGPPLVAVSACRRLIGTAVFDAVRVRNVEAVSRAVGGLPLVLPTLGEELDVPALLARIDGLYLTGSESNIDPRRYGEEDDDAADDWRDPDRDATILPLVRATVDAGIPLLAICRGFEELNVAYGGTLHRCLQELPGFMDHREDESQPRDVQYAPAHDLFLEPGSVLAGLFPAGTIRVNSLHQQGIKRLAPGLGVEGVAPDGLVEAVRVENAPEFALGVQWHPEWFATVDPVSQRLFAAFGDACRGYAARRRQEAARGFELAGAAGGS